jgi:hypothetical protein
VLEPPVDPLTPVPALPLDMPDVEPDVVPLDMPDVAPELVLPDTPDVVPAPLARVAR